ncbi:hypothetical protein D3C73_1513930 [compost metagenome]
MYLTLNLCRVLYFVKEGKVASKREGGEWGVQSLPHKFQPLVKQCLNEYTDETDDTETDISRANSSSFLAFVDYMIQEIKINISLSYIS